MRTASFFILAVSLLVIQTTLLQSLPEWAGKPDLLFILVIFIATSFETYRGAVLVLLCGLIMDIFSGVYLGFYPLLYLLIFFSIKWIERQINLEEPTYQAPLIIVSYLMLTIGLFILSAILSPENQLHWSWRAILLQLLILSIISVPLRHLYDRIFPVLDKKPATVWSLNRARNRFKK